MYMNDGAAMCNTQISKDESTDMNFSGGEGFNKEHEDIWYEVTWVGRNLCSDK